jgi:hypothetical protein
MSKEIPNTGQELDAQYKKDMAWVCSVIEQAQAVGTYGEVTIIFERGVVTRLVRKTSHINPRLKNNTC